MNIGFDAKRAFQNSTGLGHYSRTLISSLAKYFPQHHYFLFAPRITAQFTSSEFNNIENVSPQGFPANFFTSIWRSNWIKKDLLDKKIDLYHGLSHEIPFGIQKTGIPSVVTIHDLIFERYPKQYNPIDVSIYRKKFRHACEHANHIIAISQQTKQDVMEYYKIPEAKISVCYQSCNPHYTQRVSENEKEKVRKQYQLPDSFYLYVGSIIERKNLLLICKALDQLKHSIPLVVIGSGTGHYIKEIKKYIAGNNLTNQVIFLSEHAAAIESASFKNAADFPAIYQMAVALIYPSIFEGFGIPVLEAMCSGTPVITSNISCMPETGGDAAFYIDPFSEEAMAHAMQEISTNAPRRDDMIQKGMLHAAKFSPELCANAVMNVYQQL